MLGIVPCVRLVVPLLPPLLLLMLPPCCRYGAVLVLQGAMTLGDLNAFMLYAIYVAGSAGGLAGTAAQVIAAVSI
jgi:ABC-type bacteriocin/lantibiotic exporter with double-glycine peptidase domain